MQTPWGDLAVCDAHVHFFSPAFFSTLAAQSRKSLDALGWQLPHSVEELADAWHKELGRHGVRKAVLIASIPGDEDSVAAAVARHPDRFYGYFMLNPLAPDALERMRRAAGRLHAVCLFPAMHRYSIQDERLKPILSLASTVFVHCGVLTVRVRKKLGLASPFDMRFSNPIDLHAVALEYPHVNFIVPHFGAGYLREALMLCDLCPNVYLDTSSSNSWVKYLGIDLRQVFRRALDVIGPKRLLFGSDSSFFPRGWHAAILESQIRILYELAVSAEDAALILSGNFQTIFEKKSVAVH